MDEEWRMAKLWLLAFMDPWIRKMAHGTVV